MGLIITLLQLLMPAENRRFQIVKVYLLPFRLLIHPRRQPQRLPLHLQQRHRQRLHRQ